MGMDWGDWLYYPPVCVPPATPQPGQLSVATLTSQLANAQTAYDALMTGKSVSVYIDSNGEQVRYNQAKSSDLYNYIQSLIQQISDATNPAPSCGPRNGPLQFLF